MDRLMTEVEWCGRNNGDYSAVLRAVGQLSERKQRLLACACCELVKQAHPAGEIDVVIRAVEQYVETGRSRAALLRMRRRLVGERERAFLEGQLDRFFLVSLLSDTVSFNAKRTHPLSLAPASAGHCLTRFGGTTSPVSNRQTYPLYRDMVSTSPVDLSWRTSNVLSLARGIYEDRAFDRLPILADALEDAGCASADVLGHCRGPGQHSRGCWVVDLLLGKG